MKYISDTEQLTKNLENSQYAYLLHGELPGAVVELQFEGSFEQQQVVWNACITTLTEYVRQNPASDVSKQFIDIQQQNGCFMVNVGLNLDQIDRATVERTIIMVRKYKRLQRGRHEYGANSKCQSDTAPPQVE